ncbi:MAG: LysM peptidoglycan-binding domain-containing protein [Proteobacteria bacterium]|nr:LysM peptidoglycan-binding domain-containing protein [Pseudomonadota bacterium]MBU4599145.1 LysM peptidoglycan-binding domain-containing protein [Pseudomonadota bacterium]
MRKLMILLIVVLFLHGHISQAKANDDLVVIPFPAIYWVKAGDTLLRIADQSYMSVYFANKESLKEITINGRPNPNRIMEGMPLRIPAGTPVRKYVAQAIASQDSMKAKVLGVLAKAKSLRNALVRLEAGVGDEFKRGEDLLGEAQGLIDKGPGYAGIGMIQAYSVAQQALDRFHAAKLKSNLERQIARLQQRLADDTLKRKGEASAFEGLLVSLNSRVESLLRGGSRPLADPQVGLSMSAIHLFLLGGGLMVVLIIGIISKRSITKMRRAFITERLAFHKANLMSWVGE